MRKRSVFGLVILASGFALLSAGCETGLVTGYQPRRLGDSPAARRAYYAGKFTPQARAADEDRAEELRLRRPNPGGGGPSPY